MKKGKRFLKVDEIVEIFLHGNQLKRTARTGWVQRGVPSPEDVAAHSFGVAFATLILSQLIDEPIDLGLALAMALLHDLPEGMTSDIPSPAWRFLPAGTKPGMEAAALDEILGQASFAPHFKKWWQNLEKDESAEARLVHDADKIDLFVQALVYEEQTSNKHLQEFWEGKPTFYFAAGETIYQALSARRRQASA